VFPFLGVVADNWRLIRCLRHSQLLDGFDPVPQPYHQQPPQQQPQQQQQYGDLLLQSPQRQAPAGDRSTMLGNFGKDLFTIANSPRSSGNNPGSGDAPTAERSAFNFM
jgi:hypothetical protein